MKETLVSEMRTPLIVGALSRRNCPGPNFGPGPPLTENLTTETLKNTTETLSH